MGRGPQSERRRNLNKGGAQGKVWRSRVWAPKRRSEGLLGLGVSSRSSNTFILFLHPQGCAQSLRKWLHNNLISIMAICLGAGLLEVTWPRPIIDWSI